MIYSKKITGEWKKAFERYESISGFEPMYQDDVDSGSMTIREAWLANVAWLEDVVGDVSGTKVPSLAIEELNR